MSPEGCNIDAESIEQLKKMEKMVIRQINSAPDPTPEEDIQTNPTRDDNWIHRSAGMTCQTCMWFTMKDPATVGRCRRHAPNQVAIGWPAVFPTDWCGDHKIDETKIEIQEKR